jgi:hypothetical protein
MRLGDDEGAYYRGTYTSGWSPDDDSADAGTFERGTGS